VIFDLVGGDSQKRSFPVLKEGGHLVSATQPVAQEEAAAHRVSGAMMRLAPTALEDAAQAWKDIARNLPEVHGVSPGARVLISSSREATRSTILPCGLGLAPPDSKRTATEPSAGSLAGRNLVP
jgi:hypothetical protein